MCAVYVSPASNVLCVRLRRIIHCFRTAFCLANLLPRSSKLMLTRVHTPKCQRHTFMLPPWAKREREGGERTRCRAYVCKMIPTLPQLQTYIPYTYKYPVGAMNAGRVAVGNGLLTLALIIHRAQRFIVNNINSSLVLALPL